MIPQIKASTVLNTKQKKILDYFENLAAHPEKYQFDSHLGIQLVSGNLDKPGSKFYTEEIFAGIKLRLNFKITSVKTINKKQTQVNKKQTQQYLEFRLINPLRALKIHGQFIIDPIINNYNQHKNRLSLIVFSKIKLKFNIKSLLIYLITLCLFISPIRCLIKKQISKEIHFIQSELS